LNPRSTFDLVLVDFKRIRELHERGVGVDLTGERGAGMETDEAKSRSDAVVRA
jgi:hypothetical protein